MKDAFELFRERLIEELFKQQAYKEAKAFGTFEAFVKSKESAEITDERYIQYGTAYTTTLDVGRSSGKFPPIGPIYEWVGLRKYGIDWQTESQRRSIAFLIARKQAQSGSYKRRNTGAKTEMIATAIAKARPTLNEALLSWQRASIESEVIKKIQEINGNS